MLRSRMKALFLFLGLLNADRSCGRFQVLIFTCLRPTKEDQTALETKNVAKPKIVLNLEFIWNLVLGAWNFR